MNFGSTLFLVFIGCPFLGISLINSQFTLPNQPIKDALYLHNTSISNLTLKDCSFRPSNNPNVCPDQDIRFILYTPGGKREIFDYSQHDWLRQSGWDPDKENIILVHGYAGGDDTLPMVVLRDAYIRNGSYNVWFVDWGVLCQPPCYRAGVHNTKAVAMCIGHLFTQLRKDGLDTDKVTCVGHSLGAHVCGQIFKFVVFRVHRIVGLDPARPLITNSIKLNSGSAGAVHVLHTNAGHYGEGGRAGHVDFCINGGKVQPFCENVPIDDQLCSHVWAVCYMAESIFPHLAKKAEPCSRRCPSGPRPGHRIGIPIYMGQQTPLSSSGSYCIRDERPPFCPTEAGGFGDPRCCLKAPDYKPPSTTPMNDVDSIQNKINY
ncbi:phospholipase A1 VesT1.02-like [Coccinella septempunctata]|uniref:phospholipase A1 VesT1.02-like n=1 Tax=Coccinella septempunctata TaxID=41139 RepID=UPI001D060544|nr:phospholipase A1 VesT1.02-like [Coccinella septempunctata]